MDTSNWEKVSDSTFDTSNWEKISDETTIPDNVYIPDDDPLVQQYGGIQATPVSWWDTITDNVSAGLKTAAIPLAKGADWLSDKLFPETDIYGERANDNYSLTKQYLDDIESVNNANADAGGFQGTIGETIQGLSSMAPMVASAIATGGGTLIPAAVQGLNTGLGSYVTNVENGADSGDAALGALISGGSEAITSLPFTKLLKGAGKFIPNLLEAGLTNAADAGLQTLAQDIADGDSYNADGGEYWSNIKKGVLMGLGMGAFLGGAGKVGRAINNRFNGNAKKLADIEANMRNLSDDANVSVPTPYDFYTKANEIDPATGEPRVLTDADFTYKSDNEAYTPIKNNNGEIIGVHRVGTDYDYDNNGNLIEFPNIENDFYFKDFDNYNPFNNSGVTPTEIETASGTLGNFDYVPEQILDTPQTPSKPNLELVVDNQINPEKLSYLASNQDDFIDPFTVARYQKQYGVDRNTAIQIIQRENAEAQAKLVKDTYPQEKPKPELKLIADNAVDDLTLQRIKNQYNVSDADAVKIALQEKKATNQLTLPEKQLSEADIQAQENWRNKNVAPEVIIKNEKRTPKDTNVKIPKDKIFKNVEEFKQTQEELAQKPAIDAVTTEVTPVAKMVRPEDLMTEKSPVSRVSADEMAVKPDLMQFKSVDEEGRATGTNKENRLTGSKWDDQAGGVLLLWEPVNKAEYGLTGNQKYIVANGHHRFELGNRLGVKDYNVQIVKEADGWSAADARNKAAFNNILDGKGSAEDQIVFLRNYAETQGLDKAEAIANKLGLQKGNAYPIAIYSSPRLYSLYKSGKIRDAKAAASIARGAPNDEAIQMVGYQKLQEGYSPASVENFEKSYKAITQDNPNIESLFGDDQFDLFANDSKEKALQNMMMDASEYVESQLKDLRNARKAVKPAANAVDLAKKGGVNVKNQAKSQAYVNNLETQIKQLENWASDPTLRQEILNKVIADKGGKANAIAPVQTPKEIKADVDAKVDEAYKQQEAVENVAKEEAKKNRQVEVIKAQQDIKLATNESQKLTTELNKLKKEATTLKKKLNQSNLNETQKNWLKTNLEENRKSQIQLTHEIKQKKSLLEKLKDSLLNDEGGYFRPGEIIETPVAVFNKAKEAVDSVFNRVGDSFGNQDLQPSTDPLMKVERLSSSENYFRGAVKAVKDTIDPLIDKDYKGLYNYASPFLGWVRKNFTMPKTLADKFPDFKPTYEAGQNQIARLSSNSTEFMKGIKDYSMLSKADRDIVTSAMAMNRLQYLREGKFFKETYDNWIKAGLTPDQANAAIALRNTLNLAIDKIEEAKIANIDPNVTEATRLAKIQEIKQEVSAMRHTNYFPLTRQGKYVLYADNVNGERYYEMFNDKSKLEKKQKEFKDQGILSTIAFADEDASIDHMIRAQGVAGFDTDYNRSLGEYFSNIARWNSKSLGAVEFREALKQIKEKDVGLRNYAEKFRRDLNTTNPQIVNAIRSIVVTKALSNPMTAAVNLTQPLITTYPETVKYLGTAKAIKTFHKSALQQSEYLISKKKFNAKYKELGQAIEEAKAKGILSGNALQMIHEMSEGKKNFVTDSLENISDLLLKPFAASEQISRGHAFITGWNIAESMGKTNYADKFNFASNFSDTTQFNTNKANRPQLARGWGALPATFKLFEGNLLRTMRNNFRGDARAKMAGLQQLGIMVALGGARAIPLTSSLFALLASMGVDVEGEAKRLSKKLTDSTWWADLITEGIPTLLGFNIKGNLMSSNIMPASAEPEAIASTIGKLFIGSSWQLGEDAINAIKFASQGNYSKAASKVLPRAIANVVDASRWYTQGRVDDSKGRVIIDNPTLGEVIGKMAGMTPTRVNQWYSDRNAIYDLKDKTVSQSIEDKIGQMMAYKDRDGVASLLQDAKDNGLKINNGRVRSSYEKYALPMYSQIKSMSEQGKSKALEELLYRDEDQLKKILKYKNDWAKYLPRTPDMIEFIRRNYNEIRN